MPCQAGPLCVCLSVCLSVPAQRADAQSERLSRELRALRDERTELLQRASALRSDNDRQAGHIRHIQGTGVAVPSGNRQGPGKRSRSHGARSSWSAPGSLHSACHKSC